ncbi:MAG: SBBP repeat-containing protein [bacterium]
MEAHVKVLVLNISIFLFIISSSISYSQVITQWSSTYNGQANDTDEVTSMKVDNQGNVYITGYSCGSSTKKDFATIKYNSAGVQLWVAIYNNNELNGDDIASAVEVDASGNVYVTGQSAGAGTFADYLTIKYSSTGEQLWIARYNGKGNDDDKAFDIAIDGLGSVYVTGYSVGAVSSEDFTTIKYTSAGKEQWVAFYNNDKVSDIDIATSLALDGSGNVYVTGYSVGNGTAEDYATVKYNTSGDEIWTARYNGDGNNSDITSSLAVDASGNVYVTGFSIGNGTSEDYATIKYNTSGDMQWVKRFNGVSSQYDIATSIDIDNSDNVYVTGYSYNIPSSEDYMTIKYNSNGDEQWAAAYDGTGGDFDIANIVKVDNSGNVYVSGYSYGKNSLEDYVTVKYNSKGIEQWTEIFNGKANGSDIVTSLALDNDGNIYVTGYSYEGSTSIDYVTLKYSQTVGISQTYNSVPEKFSLQQNYPNPFNPLTTINYRLGVTNDVSLKIFDILGNEVANLVNQKQNAGTYSFEFDAHDLPSGIYFYSLIMNGITAGTKRMVLLK